MSSASSRTRWSSVARVACSIPASRSRWPSTATIANTRLKTTIWAQDAVSSDGAVGPEGVAQIQQRGQDGGDRNPGRRHEQRVGGHHQDVQCREGGLRLAGEVHDRGDQTQVDERLDQEKGIGRGAAQQEHGARPIAGEHQGEDHCHTDDEGFLRSLGPDQPGPEQDAGGEHQTADE